jgi:hypothetical protein
MKGEAMEQPTAPKPPGAAISARELSKRYGRRQAVTAALPQPERDAWEAAGDDFSAGVDVFDTQGGGTDTSQGLRHHDRRRHPQRRRLHRRPPPHRCLGQT